MKIIPCSEIVSEGLKPTLLQKNIYEGKNFIDVEELNEWILKRRNCRNNVPSSWTLDDLEKELKGDKDEKN